MRRLVAMLALLGAVGAALPALAEPLPDGRLPPGFLDGLPQDPASGGNQDHVVGEEMCARPR